MALEAAYVAEWSLMPERGALAAKVGQGAAEIPADRAAAEIEPPHLVDEDLVGLRFAQASHLSELSDALLLDLAR